MRTKFSQPGGPGSKFKNLHDKMMKSLALPKGAKDELGIQGDSGMPPLEENEVNNAEQDDDEQASVERKKHLHESKMQRELY